MREIKSISLLIPSRWIKLGSNGKLVAISIGVQILFLICLGFEIPVLRSFLGFVLLTFLPGMLLLGILGEDLNRVESLIYSIAASLGLLMFFGLLLNSIYLVLHEIMPKPFTESTFTTGFVVFLIVSTFLFRKTGKQPRLPSWKSLEEILSPLPLFMLLLVILGVLSGILARYSNNFLALLLLPIVAIIPLAAITYFNLTSKYCSIIIWGISAFLVFQTIMMPIFIKNEDAIHEYYIANLTLSHGFWNPSFGQIRNAMLQLTMLHPIYSLVCGISLLEEFRIIHPLLLSVMPVALYQIFSKQFSQRTAFLSVCLYVFLHPFFTVLAQNTRTGSALLFTTIFVLLNSDSHINSFTRSILSIIIMFGLIVSHYGVAYIFMFMLITAYILMHLVNIRHETLLQKSFLSLTMVIFFFVLLQGWYLYTASSKPFTFLNATFIDRVLLAIKDFLTPVSGAGYIATIPLSSFTYNFIKIEALIIIVFSSIGILTILTKLFFSSKRKIASALDIHRLQELYFYLSVTAILLLLIAFLAPATGAIGVNRIFMISGLFIVPFFIIGLQALSAPASKLAISDSKLLKAVSLFLAFMLLVNSGFLATTVFHERSPRPILDKQRILKEGSDLELFHFFKVECPNRDLQASKWLAEHKNEGWPIYGSEVIVEWLGGFFYTSYSTTVPPGSYVPLKKGIIGTEQGYIYLGEYATRAKKVGLMKISEASYHRSIFIEFSELNLDKASKIYDTGQSTVLLSNKD